MDKNINPVLVCVDKSEQHPDGIAFSVTLPSGIVAFDVCYNGTIKNVKESVVFTEQILYNLSKLAGLMKRGADNGVFDFDDDYEPTAIIYALYSNKYFRNLVNLMWK